MLFNTVEVLSLVKSIFSLGLDGLLDNTSVGARVLNTTMSSGVIVVLFLGGFSVVNVNVSLPFKLARAVIPLLVPLVVLLLQQVMIGGKGRVG